MILFARRPAVRLCGESLAGCDDRGREGERAAPRCEEQPGERGRGESEELAEGGLSQADDRRLQRGQGGRGRLQEGSETLGQKAQGGEGDGNKSSTSIIILFLV